LTVIDARNVTRDAAHVYSAELAYARSPSSRVNTCLEKPFSREKRHEAVVGTELLLLRGIDLESEVRVVCAAELAGVTLREPGRENLERTRSHYFSAHGVFAHGDPPDVTGLVAEEAAIHSLRTNEPQCK
jgi:hypothetical protein